MSPNTPDLDQETLEALTNAIAEAIGPILTPQNIGYVIILSEPGTNQVTTTSNVEHIAELAPVLHDLADSLATRGDPT